MGLVTFCVAQNMFRRSYPITQAEMEATDCVMVCLPRLMNIGLLEKKTDEGE